MVEDGQNDNSNMHHSYAPLGRNNCTLTEIGVATGVLWWRYSFLSTREKSGGIVSVIDDDDDVINVTQFCVESIDSSRLRRNVTVERSYR